MNKVAEFAGQALDVLWHNPLRSLLTTLGLIIGVGSVIAILAVGDSTTKSVLNILSPYSLASAFVFPKQQQPDPLLAQIRYDDADRVRRAVPDAKDVLPIMSLPMETRVNHQDKTVRVITAGAGQGTDTTPLAEGRLFNAQDLSAHRRVAILSAQARHELLGDDGSAVGRFVRLNGSDFEVVGVQAPPINGGLLGSGTTGLITVTVPYTLIPQLGYTYVYGLTIVAQDSNSVVQVANEAIAALKKIHGARAQYEERDIKQLNEGIERVFGILTGVVGVVAGISLIVGGVGIMNIMLVSVTERTREIGIRKAIGATRGDIVLQFFVEALLLCLVGGILGLIIGVGLAEIVIHLWIKQLTPNVVSFGWGQIIAVALIFSAGVGVLFGTYPAVRASYLNPIEALRYE
ncbi:MAG: ABC transporter permease [Candidatus Eremiobacteraeota bacterium]|nr:ABC transporter permease [Candidatus Eremiobacteraeota bacterium]MBV8222868.1 ABC transporter permease [Candidatus Eremiobacteraeota bacterium]